MHDPTKSGNEFFLCDFCRRHWEPDRPMVEGHQGSLICGHCLTAAYASVVRLDQAAALPPGAKCTLCLEERPDKHWTSPLHPECAVCARCIRQAAGTLSKDKESAWSRPA